jgi:hypothetical protein
MMFAIYRATAKGNVAVSSKGVRQGLAPITYHLANRQACVAS